jgi:hypothetical protein
MTSFKDWRLHAFERKIVRTKGYDIWVRNTERAQNAKVRLLDREGIARLMANSYVRQFIYLSNGSTIPRAYFQQPDLYFEAANPGTLSALIDWCIDTAKLPDAEPEYTGMLVDLRSRLESLFEACPAPMKGTETEFLRRLDTAIAELAASA